MKGEKTVDALLVCAIIISASIIVVPYLIPKPTPEITLYILTRHDTSILQVIEESFLASSFAVDNNIVDIEWVTLDSSMWNALVESGSIDLLMGPWDQISAFGQNGQLEPMSFGITSGVNETIAGIPMKVYLERQPIACCYTLFLTYYDLFVNETRLQESGLSSPDNVKDMLSPGFCPNGTEYSLIGIANPEMGSVGHRFQYVLSKSYGWEDAIHNLTILYANSRIYDSVGAAYDALESNEIALTFTVSMGQFQEPSHYTLSQKHLQNQFIVYRSLIGIANNTSHKIESEAFIEFLLSPEGQSNWLIAEGSSLPVRRETFEVVQGEFDESTYEQFIWMSRSEGVAETEFQSSADYALWFYMNSTVFTPHAILAGCWENIINAYNNGSILLEEFEMLEEMLGEPLTIIDPYSNLNESFTEEYALEMLTNLFSLDYETEVSYLWYVAAMQRYEMVFSLLASILQS